MKLLTFLTTIGLTTLATMAGATSNYDLCAGKSAEVIKAIDIFCAKLDLAVPSDYAS